MGEKVLLAFLGLLISIAGVMIVAVMFAIFYPFGIMENYSDGQRTGDIYKFSKKGIIAKSYEGAMYLGGYSSSGGKNPTLETDKFYFSLPGDEAPTTLIAQLNECAEKRTGCTIYYKQWLLNPWYLDSRYVVTGVKAQEIK